MVINRHLCPWPRRSIFFWCAILCHFVSCDSPTRHCWTFREPDITSTEPKVAAQRRPDPSLYFQALKTKEGFSRIVEIVARWCSRIRENSVSPAMPKTEFSRIQLHQSASLRLSAQFAKRSRFRCGAGQRSCQALKARPLFVQKFDQVQMRLVLPLDDH